MSMYHAITVTTFYLDKKCMCIKWLRVEYRKSGQPYWFVDAVTHRHENGQAVLKEAKRLSEILKLPFIEDISRGMNLTKSHIAILEEWGIKV